MGGWQRKQEKVKCLEGEVETGGEQTFWVDEAEEGGLRRGECCLRGKGEEEGEEVELWEDGQTIKKKCQEREDEWLMWNWLKKRWSNFVYHYLLVHVYLCLPMFTRVYLYLLVFT